MALDTKKEKKKPDAKKPKVKLPKIKLTDKQKQELKEANKAAKKNGRSWRVILLLVLLIVFTVMGILVGIHFLCQAKGCFDKKKDNTQFTITIKQPANERFKLYINDKKDSINVKVNQKLTAKVTVDEEYEYNLTNYLNQDASLYYIHVTPTVPDVTKPDWDNELGLSSSREYYESNFAMYWNYNVTVSVMGKSDFEDTFYCKNQDDQIKYYYDKVNIYDSTSDYIRRYDALEQTYTDIKKTEFNDEIWVGKNVDKIYAGFLGSCTAFNSPIHFFDDGKLTTIEDDFLDSCSGFDQELTFPTTLTTINGDFMTNCSKFNHPIDTKNVSTLNTTNFLYKANSFNSPVTLGSALKEIPSRFMIDCPEFAQPFTIPETITKINPGLLMMCDKINEIVVNCPESAFKTMTNKHYVCSTYNESAQCLQGNGVGIKGTSAQAWYNCFPDLSGSLYEGLRRKSHVA